MVRYLHVRDFSAFRVFVARLLKRSRCFISFMQLPFLWSEVCKSSVDVISVLNFDPFLIMILVLCSVVFLLDF